MNTNVLIRSDRYKRPDWWKWGQAGADKCGHQCPSVYSSLLLLISQWNKLGLIVSDSPNIRIPSLSHTLGSSYLAWREGVEGGGHLVRVGWLEVLEAGTEDLLAGLEGHGSCEGWREVRRVLELRHRGPGGRGQWRAQPFLTTNKNSGHFQDLSSALSIIGNSWCFYEDILGRRNYKLIFWNIFG